MNTSLLCSIILPTRRRLEKLSKMVASFAGSADPSRFDMRIKIDGDDSETINGLAEIIRNAPFDILATIAPRGNGWADLHWWDNELSSQSNAKWVWIINDDMTLEGKDWDKLLDLIPLTGFIVQPEIHRLGGSTYLRTHGGPFPIVPNGSWKQFGMTIIDEPPDTSLDQLLRVKNGWQTKWLEGIGFWHQRDEDSVLEAHRKL